MKALVLESCAKETGKLVEIAQLYEIISNPRFCQRIEEAREVYRAYISLHASDPLRAEKLKDEYANIKKKLIFACFGLAPESGKRNDKSLSGLMYMDFDYKENSSFEVETIKEILIKEFPNLVLAYKSASGLGLAAVLYYGEWLTPELYKKIYLSNALKLQIKYGLIADEQCAHCERGAFVSNDLEAFFNPDPEAPDSVAVITEANILLEGKSSAEENYIIESNAGLEKDILEVVDYCKKNNVLLVETYYEWLYVLSVICKSFRNEPEKAFTLGHAVSSIYQLKYNKKDTDKKITALLKRPLERITERTFYYYAAKAGFKIYAPAKNYSYLEFEKLLGKTDTELAQYLCEKLFENNIKYNVTTNAFMFYKEGVWETNPVFKINEHIDKFFVNLAQETYQALLDEEKCLPASIKKKREKEFDAMYKNVFKFKDRFSKTYSNVAFSSHFKNLESIAVCNEFLDKHRDKICLSNGVFCLSKFYLMKHEKEYLFSKKLNITYNPYADCPRFLEFLNEIFEGEQEYIEFLQKFLGLCLTGFVDRFQGVLFFYGSGSNGKSVLIRIIEEFFKGYYANLNSDIIVSRERGYTNEEYLKAGLFGARLAIVSEMPINGRIKDNVIKELTGGDTIQARLPYQKPFSFAPSHKIIMYGNHKPYIPAGDDALWRRMYLINFSRVFKEEERRPAEEIIEEIKAEFPGVLNWMIKGYATLCDEGGTLQMTPKMKQDVLEYRNSQNPLYDFLSSNFVEAEGESVESEEVYSLYLQYCEENNLQARKVLNKYAFSKAINNTILNGLKLAIKRVGKAQKKHIFNIRKLSEEEKENHHVPF
jgi:P4 family phage/plasmid primase-like protien